MLRLIRRLLGEISPEVESQVKQLSLAKLDILGEEIFDMKTIADVENWLDSQREIEE
ncbi:MAG: DUF4351 domain-containing protein [Okeania sp. SIO3H1]|nr:DUF4351 domain-containing protein [Okeania sp. SIO3H1]